MKTKILDLSIDTSKRLLFLSDIHADLKGLKEILNKANYTKDDYLFLVGDIIEKGYENIDILDYIMKLQSDGYNLYYVCGNCDDVLSYLINPVDNDLLLNYALIKKKTIINEFASRLNIKIDSNSDMSMICDKFYKEFRKYFDYIKSLYHVININNLITVVHGGIMDLSNIECDAINVMKCDNFYRLSKKQEKLMIVGHYPTIIYQDKLPNSNPIIDLEKNIISIDGGNNVVLWGQINLLTIDNLNNMNINYITYDHNKLVRVFHQEESINSYNLDVLDNEVIILREIDDYYLCKHKTTNKELYILKNMIYKTRDKTKAYDAFDHFSAFIDDEEVSLVVDASPYCIVKKDGIASFIDKNKVRR